MNILQKSSRPILKKLITNLRKANELFALSSYLLANNRLTKTKEKNEK